MDTLTTALMWRSLGIATIPILHRSKLPALDQWKPYQGRLPTEFELRAWFSRPGYNIAVVTGWQGLVIVDFDSPAAWRRFVSKNISLTYYVLTSRGRHLYFYCETARCISLNGIDIKANGGYCLTPPSIHPSGHIYTSIGSSDEIVHLKSITDILPEYQAISRPPARPRVSTLAPLDAALLPHTSTTIEEANDKLRFDELLARATYGRHYICPFHDDKEPSLKVYPDGHWYCFGCNIGGRDKLDLYTRFHNITIREALCTL